MGQGWIPAAANELWDNSYHVGNWVLEKQVEVDFFKKKLQLQHLYLFQQMKLNP